MEVEEKRITVHVTAQEARILRHVLGKMRGSDYASSADQEIGVEMYEVLCRVAPPND